MIVELQTLEIKSISGGLNIFSKICKVINNVIGKPLEAVGKGIKGTLIDDGTDKRPPQWRRDMEQDRQKPHPNCDPTYHKCTPMTD